MQSAVAGSTAVPLTEPKGRGNAGSVESMENQTQVSHAFHRPLKIPRRDFHISTAPAMTVISLNQKRRKDKERKSAAARPPHFLVSALPPVARPISCSSFDWKMLMQPHPIEIADVVVWRVVKPAEVCCRLVEPRPRKRGEE
jgi:hypothetical protein